MHELFVKEKSCGAFLDATTLTWREQERPLVGQEQTRDTLRKIISMVNILVYFIK